MKQCPRCHAVTDEICTCPVCKMLIAHESESPETRESFAFNRYTVLYFVRRLWSAALSFLFTLGSIIVRWPLTARYEQKTITIMNGYSFTTTVENPHNDQYLWAALLVAVLGVIITLFEKQIIEWAEDHFGWKYSDFYIEKRVRFARYGAIVWSFFMTLLVWITDIL